MWLRSHKIKKRTCLCNWWTLTNMCENLLIAYGSCLRAPSINHKDSWNLLFSLYFFLYISSFMHILTKTYVTLSRPDCSKDISVHVECVVCWCRINTTYIYEYEASWIELWALHRLNYSRSFYIVMPAHIRSLEHRHKFWKYIQQLYV